MEKLPRIREAKAEKVRLKYVVRERHDMEIREKADHSTKKLKKINYLVIHDWL